MREPPYTTDYFDSHLAGSVSSARAVLPIVLDLVDVRSVVDVGCGVGAWLSVLVELGIDDIVGIDGAYVDPKRLLFPEEFFVSHDLTRHLCIDRTFDLAMSLEVAEHLPAERAHHFIELLTGLASIVVFSAAIPGQGGIDHKNEQWPEYWVHLFERRGYTAIDAVRQRIWWSPGVEPYYAQNILIFASVDALAGSPRLQRELERQGRLLDVVHPRIFDMHRRSSDPPTVQDLLLQLPRAVFRSLGLAGTRTRIVSWLQRMKRS